MSSRDVEVARKGEPLLPYAKLEQVCTDDPARTHSALSRQDVVQFAAFIVYVEYEEEVAKLEVMRIGSMQGQCRVTYCTEDGSAEAGVDFIRAEGELVFADGEDTKTIDVDLHVPKHWSKTIEFRLRLAQNEGCQLGAYLHSCRVKIISKDFFPSNRYREQLARGRPGIEEVGAWALFLDFVKLIFLTRGVALRSVMNILLRQSSNFNLVMALWCSLYLVDVLFGKDEKASEDQLILHEGPYNGRIHTAALLGLLYFTPMLVVHLCDAVCIHIDLQGRVNHFLRTNLFNRYLNYTTRSRKSQGDSWIQDAVIQELEKLTGAYMEVLRVTVILGRLVVLAYFVFRKVPSAAAKSMAMPVLMVLFAVARAGVLRSALGRLNTQEISLIGLVQDVCSRYELIASYLQRPRALDDFSACSRETERAQNAVEMVLSNNMFVGSMLAPLAVGMHVAFNAINVIEGRMSLGEYVTSIHIYKEISMLYIDMYTSYLKISGALGAFKNCVVSYNMPTELLDRKALSRARRKRTLSTREETLIHRRCQREEDGEHVNFIVPAADTIDLRLEEISWSFGKMPILNNVSMRFPQGHIIALCGNSRSGKATLMRLFASELLTTSGLVFVPSHLRALYVPQEPIFLARNAWDNLTFGDDKASPSVVRAILLGLGMEEIWAICTRELRAAGRGGELPDDNERQVPEMAPESVVEMGAIGENDRATAWIAPLSHCQRAKVNLARALVMNPELLLLQRPLCHFDRKQHRDVRDIMVEHVKNRGFGMPRETVEYRRPRTLIFAPTFQKEMDIADQIWTIDSDTGSLHSVPRSTFMDDRGSMRSVNPLPDGSHCRDEVAIRKISDAIDLLLD